MADIPTLVWALGTVPKILENRFAEIEIERRIETIGTSALLKICVKTYNNDGVLRILAATKTYAKNSQLKL